jgi:hypothetical protein
MRRYVVENSAAAGRRDPDAEIPTTPQKVDERQTLVVAADARALSAGKATSSGT